MVYSSYKQKLPEFISKLQKKNTPQKHLAYI